MANSKAEEFKEQIIKSHSLILDEADLGLLRSQLDLLITYIIHDIAKSGSLVPTSSQINKSDVHTG